MVYNYTRPRGRIAAMDSSPGPVYALPPLVGRENHDPRSVHSRGPAYPLGNRHRHADKDECSPGPGEYLPKNRVLRTGTDYVPAYSVTGRVREPKWFTPPGPGAYYPENSYRKVKPVEPAYSMASRHNRSEQSDIPGPNMYNAPPMLGRTYTSPKRQAPSYSISGRHNNSGNEETPGPATYQVPDIGLVRRSPPKHSVTGRVRPPQDDAARKPGPGAYSTGEVWTHKKQEPRFSFGIRHSQYSSTLITPADNAL